ncbi:hypothetical protein [Bradyrhizobium sp. dw_78]|uniref:hypothetical protein n=1 Tax=Bradyrhizobium sp. dw_78 TaxID=2719793 RepID=UPI001BD233B7|nr:hypothetical protein [Bradyrhizobium sp. dw_78]
MKRQPDLRSPSISASTFSTTHEKLKTSSTWSLAQGKRPFGLFQKCAKRRSKLASFPIGAVRHPVFLPPGARRLATSTHEYPQLKGYLPEAIAQRKKVKARSSKSDGSLQSDAGGGRLRYIHMDILRELLRAGGSVSQTIRISK